MRPVFSALSITLLIAIAAGTTWAGPLTVPNTFSAGTTAKASEVNANFNAVETEVTDNASDITTNASDIADNTSDIADNASDIAANADDIASNADSITDVKDELSDKMDQVLTCSNNQVLKWNGADWVCADDAVGGTGGDADTLDGLNSTDFAESIHTHPGLPTGVHWISPLEFRAWNWNGSYNREDFIIGPSYVGWADTSVERVTWAPIRIPFKCTIIEMQFRARDNSDSADIFVGIYDGSEAGDEWSPIASADTSGWASTSTNGNFSTGPISLAYDPTDFGYSKPWWIGAYIGDTGAVHRLRPIKIFYTVP